MFWKAAVFLGLLGIVVGIALIIGSVALIASEGVSEKVRDLGVFGLIAGIVIVLVSILATFLGIVFTMRGSKREYESKK